MTNAAWHLSIGQQTKDLLAGIFHIRVGAMQHDRQTARSFISARPLISGFQGLSILTWHPKIFGSLRVLWFRSIDTNTVYNFIIGL